MKPRHPVASRRRPAIALAVFAAAFGTLGIVSYTRKSATWDEPMHLTAGYAALTRGDYRVDPSHPPFVRMWAALPAAAGERPAIDTSGVDRMPRLQWLRGGAYRLAHRFLYVDNDADRFLYRGRFMVLLWGVVLGGLLFAWAYEWVGFAPAAIALAGYTLEPNIAAHTSLVTTDAGVACFIFGAVYFLWRACRRMTALDVLGTAICCGLAVVTKFSGLALAPIVAALLAAAVWRGTLPLRRAVLVAGIVAVASAGTIWAAYGFRYLPAPTVTAPAPLADDRSIVAAAAHWIDGHRLLPRAYTAGLLFTRASFGNQSAFLAGRYSQEGWWYYFPVAFLIKTPLALLALIAITVALAVRRRAGRRGLDAVFIVVPIAIYMALAMSTAFNVGVRHILPIYPFLLLAVAWGAREMIAARRATLPLALAMLMTLWGVEYASIYPNTLTFFNRLVGGPANGFRYLADSNLSWGQHLKSLKAWMEKRGVDHVNLAYFGQADPAYYGLNITHLPGAPSFAIDAIMPPRLPGYVAISSTVLSGVYLNPAWRLFYRPFLEREPDAIVGNSIRVYWVEEWPTPGSIEVDPSAHALLADAMLFGFGWPQRAAWHYRQYLRRRPDDADATVHLGMALASAGDREAAIEALRRAAALDPSHPDAKRFLAQSGESPR